MSTHVDLASVVEQYMTDLISDFELKLVSLDQDEVLLKSKTYALQVIADREGATLVYFDTKSRPIRSYNLVLFLINKRRELLNLSGKSTESVDSADLIEAQVSRLAMHLRSAGRDILSGSKDWMAQYFWPVGDAGDAIDELI